MSREPVVLALAHLEARIRAQVVLVVRNRLAALESPLAQAAHHVGLAAPEEAAVVDEDQRAVVLLQHVTRVEHGGVVRPEERVVTAGIGHRLAFELRAEELTRVDVDRAARAAGRYVGQRLHTRETQADLHGELEPRVVHRRELFFHCAPPDGVVARTSNASMRPIILKAIRIRATRAGPSIRSRGKTHGRAAPARWRRTYESREPVHRRTVGRPARWSHRSGRPQLRAGRRACCRSEYRRHGRRCRRSTQGLRSRPVAASATVRTRALPARDGRPPRSPKERTRRRVHRADGCPDHACERHDSRRHRHPLDLRRSRRAVRLGQQAAYRLSGQRRAGAARTGRRRRCASRRGTCPTRS